VTIHGTNGVYIYGNVAFDVHGHCFYLEDGAEERNVLERNLWVCPPNRLGWLCKCLQQRVLGVAGLHVRVCWVWVIPGSLVHWVNLCQSVFEPE